MRLLSRRMKAWLLLLAAICCSIHTTVDSAEYEGQGFVKMRKKHASFVSVCAMAFAGKWLRMTFPMKKMQLLLWTVVDGFTFCSLHLLG